MNDLARLGCALRVWRIPTRSDTSITLSSLSPYRLTLICVHTVDGPVHASSALQRDDYPLRLVNYTPSPGRRENRERVSHNVLCEAVLARLHDGPRWREEPRPGTLQNAPTLTNPLIHRIWKLSRLIGRRRALTSYLITSIYHGLSAPQSIMHDRSRWSGRASTTPSSVDHKRCTFFFQKSIAIRLNCLWSLGYTVQKFWNPRYLIPVQPEGERWYSCVHNDLVNLRVLLVSNIIVSGTKSARQNVAKDFESRPLSFPTPVSIWCG